jgi:cation diffusion facilitator CzcD-associated flavoprotein CzcO
MAATGDIAQAIIIGAGTAGLCAAHELGRLGISYEILDRGSLIGESWRGRHPRLTMNTHRDLSTLPDSRFPGGTRAFATRDSLVQHMEDHVARNAVPIEFGVTVERVRREDRHYVLHTNKGLRRARHVIIATGRDRQPMMPEWPGIETFTGELIHSSRFGDAAEYEGKSVLVIGAGNSGFDILNHLIKVRCGPLWLAVRRAPAILPRRLLGVTVHRLSPLLARLPVPVVDRLLALSQFAAFGSLTRLGFPHEAEGGASRLRNEQVALVVDEGSIAAIRKGRVSLVPPVRAFCGGSVILADDSRLSPDVVIAATGYTPGLSDMLKDIDVLDRRGFPRINGDEQAGGLPGLWFIGMRASILGDIGSARRQATAMARSIARDFEENP